jgi:hypothetical protein
MSKNGGSNSSFVISFVCFILAYIINIPSIHYEGEASSAITDSGIFGGIIFGFIGLAMAFWGIAESTKQNNRQSNTIVFLPPPMIPSTKQVVVLREKKCDKCGQMNQISAKSCTMCMYDF